MAILQTQRSQVRKQASNALSLTISSSLPLTTMSPSLPLARTRTVIDQFISASESKWSMPSALVMLLPHGMEGAGPEHSSARLERFLQLCDDDEREMQSRDAQIRTANWQIVNPTTPANFFHVLRRQIVRPFRKPLVVMAPKQLLRHPLIKSPLSDFLPDSRFERVLIDPPNTALSRDVSCMVPPYARSRSTPRPKEGEDDVVDPSCKKLLLCSGRIWICLLYTSPSPRD